MNEPRTLDPVSLDPFEDTFRALMRPWRFGTADIAPRSFSLDCPVDDVQARGQLPKGCVRTEAAEEGRGIKQAAGDPVVARPRDQVQRHERRARP